MPWTTEPSLLTARNGLAAATCDAPAPGAGYRIYAVGGQDLTPATVATVEVYDTLAKVWSTAASMPTARLNLAAASLPGRLYVVGGTDGVSPLATNEIYDPAAGTWTAGAALPTARSGLAAVAGRDGLIYTIGGYNGSNLATVEAYNPATNSWATKASMPTARFGLAAVLGPDGLIYAIGGQGAAGNLTTVEVFNTATNSWTTGKPLPASRFALAAAVGPDGLIYAYGGQDGNGVPQNTVYSYNPTTAAPWATQASMLTPKAYLAGDAGPDGLIYAIGGLNFTAQAINEVEAFTVATASTAPDPYIGNGTYQSPDIILLDPMNNPVPIGGAPGGAWDTLLLPNTNYGIQAIIYNDATVAAPNTVVGFWHFPGGVGTAGTLIDKQTVTVPANGSLLVTSVGSFPSAGPLQHECVVVSVSNPASPYFSVDPTTGPAVIDPTIPHPAGSEHFGSAWRNTNSLAMGADEGFSFPFQLNHRGVEPLAVNVAVTATKVPSIVDKIGEAATLQRLLQGAGVHLRLPLFLVPGIRKVLPPADLGLKLQLPKGKDVGIHSLGCAEHKITVNPGAGTAFTVAGAIPRDARKGDIYLLNVAAHYPAFSANKAAVVEYLDVIYVR